MASATLPAAPPYRRSVQPVALAFVNHGRWMARCPFRCGAADEVWQGWYICRACLNAAVDGQRIPLVWPSPFDMAAIEAALAPRPVAFRNWDTTESIGYLLVENVEHGLVDPVTGAIDGDVGADQLRLPGYLALAGARLELTS